MIKTFIYICTERKNTAITDVWDADKKSIKTG